MIRDRDAKFYTKLFICLAAVFLGVRWVLYVTHIVPEVPFLDSFLRALWYVLGVILKQLSHVVEKPFKF